MIRQHAVSVTVGVGCRGVCASCADHSAVLRWQCVNLTVCVLVLTCMSSRREGGDVFWRPHSQTTPVGYAFPTLIAHVGIPVAVPRGSGINRSAVSECRLVSVEGVHASVA